MIKIITKSSPIRVSAVFLAVFFLALLFLSLKSAYNKPEVQGQEEGGALICEEVRGVENIREIPIGRTADQAEYLAQRILEGMNALIEVSQISQDLGEMAKECGRGDYQCRPFCEEFKTEKTTYFIPPKEEAETQCADLENNPLIENAQLTGQVQCKDEAGEITVVLEENCTDGLEILGYECKYLETSYNPLSCSYPGGAYPPGQLPCPAEVQEDLARFEEQAQRADQSYTTITVLLKEMQREVLDKQLEVSRKRLFGCGLTRPAREAIERGEVAGEFAFSCQTLLDSSVGLHSYLNWQTVELGGGVSVPRFIITAEPQENCYGNSYCQVQDLQGKEIPYPPGPCAEDYYCCIF